MSLKLESFTEVHLYRERVDFRKSIDGLSEIVQDEMGRSPFQLRSLFVFTNRNRSRVKILYWDETGFALWTKRLEQARFPWPKQGEATMAITSRELEWLLSGYEFWKLKPHEKLEFSCVS